MNIGEKALKELFPDKKRKISLKYSRAFKPYNANITITRSKIDFSFSHVWETISEDIQVGLAQHLLLKVFKEKTSTLNIELYEKFMDKLPRYVQNTDQDQDPELMESFQRVAEEYFNGFIDMPVLEWGQRSVRQLGLYSYHTDTVRISTIFKDLPERDSWMLDYVMYHELLHKKLGVKRNEGSCRHHTKEFRDLEAKFKIDDAENKLQSFVGGKRRYSRKRPSVKGYIRNIFK